MAEAPFSAACAANDHDQDLAYAKMLQEQDYAWFMMSGGDASFNLEDEPDSEADIAAAAELSAAESRGEGGGADGGPPGAPGAAAAAPATRQLAQSESHRDHLRTILGMMSSLGEPGAEAGSALDLESMTYEELQSLGDAIGKVQVGVSQATMQQLPVSKYSDATASRSEIDTKCAVCQEQFESSDAVLSLPCRHLYHKDCITQWLSCSKQCPICNTCVDETPSSA